MKKYSIIGVDPTALTVVALSGLVGAEPTIEHPDAANSNWITNTPRGRVFCRITNGTAVSITATAIVTKTVDEGAGEITCESPVITLAAGEVWTIGPWSANFETGGKVQVDWDLGVGSAGDVDLETYKIA